MRSFKFFLQIFVYVVVVCPIVEVLSASHGKHKGNHYSKHADEHVHNHEAPCAVCPRHGRCVPRVQCPAHVRPGSYNPLCHLDEKSGFVGVCCFTGSQHAAESDLKFRSSVPIDSADVKVAHSQSKQKLTKWLDTVQTLLKFSTTILNSTAPSFGHYMSVMTYDETANHLGKGGLLNMFAAQELKSRQALSDEALELGLTEHTDGPFCPPAPSCPNPANRYRSIGGECNNPVATSWGAVHTGYERLLPPDYSDGIWQMRSSVTGLPLSSPRLVSSSLLLDASYPSQIHNLMFMQFGQFIAHDTTSGVVFSAGNGSAISCCSGDGEETLPPELQHGACAPILTDASDEFYGQFRQHCMNFVRAQIAPASDCSVGYAKQMNGVTHFPDLSHLYGSSISKVSELRGAGGLLKTFNDYGRELPPITLKKECMTVKDSAACFESGDNHGNQIISLTVFHTIWTREHNRLARALTRLNPDWNEDVVFLEARRITQAEFQHIIYNEWLPSLLGSKMMKLFNLGSAPGYGSSYDPHVNPSLTAEFSAAAMRFGHSVVDGKFTIPNQQSGNLYEAISIPEVMFQPSRLRLRPFLDRILAGLTMQPMQNVDPFVTESLTRYLFHGGNPFGLDLASINIQRGRDYGIRPYNQYRKLCGLEPYVDWKQFSPSAGQRLASVYESPDDIDLWVGGLLEEPVEGGIVGATLSHILADQFSRIKSGDRYFYEYGPDVNPGAFTPGQLAEIKKASLFRIICDNRDGIELISLPPRAFLRADLRGNEPVPCDSQAMPSLDLSRFREI